MTIMIKDLAYYMSLPYTIQLKPDEDGGWYVTMPELPGCASVGDTEAEALDNIRDAQATWIEFNLDKGFEIPEPIQD